MFPGVLTIRNGKEGLVISPIFPSGQAFILSKFSSALSNLVLHNSNGKLGRLYYSLKDLAAGNYYNDNKHTLTLLNSPLLLSMPPGNSLEQFHTHSPPPWCTTIQIIINVDHAQPHTFNHIWKNDLDIF